MIFYLVTIIFSFTCNVMAAGTGNSFISWFISVYDIYIAYLSCWAVSLLKIWESRFGRGTLQKNIKTIPLISDHQSSELYDHVCHYFLYNYPFQFMSILSIPPYLTTNCIYLFLVCSNRLFRHPLNEIQFYSELNVYSESYYSVTNFFFYWHMLKDLI